MTCVFRMSELRLEGEAEGIPSTCGEMRPDRGAILLPDSPVLRIEDSREFLETLLCPTNWNGLA